MFVDSRVLSGVLVRHLYVDEHVCILGAQVFVSEAYIIQRISLQNVA